MEGIWTFDLSPRSTMEYTSKIKETPWGIHHPLPYMAMVVVPNFSSKL